MPRRFRRLLTLIRRARHKTAAAGTHPMNRERELLLGHKTLLEGKLRTRTVELKALADALRDALFQADESDPTTLDGPRIMTLGGQIAALLEVCGNLRRQLDEIKNRLGEE